MGKQEKKKMEIGPKERRKKKRERGAVKKEVIFLYPCKINNRGVATKIHSSFLDKLFGVCLGCVATVCANLHFLFFF